MNYSFGNCIFTVSGQLPPLSRGKLPPPVRVGVWVKVGLVLGLGDNQTIGSEENCPLRLGFGLGLVLGLRRNFPRGQLS